MKGILAGPIAAIALVGAASGAQAAAPGETMMTCTNPASGASWQIKVDYDNGTVDSVAAKIRDSEISWHDPKDGGNYSLDRTTGKLTIVYTSSTGGYFIYDQCQAKP